MTIDTFWADFLFKWPWLWRYFLEANYVLYLEDIVMLLKLNAITAAIRGQISLNIRQITGLHFEQISCSGDIYLDLVGILGIDDISTGRNILTWSHILLTQIYKYVEDITIFEEQCNDVNKNQIQWQYISQQVVEKLAHICEILTHFDPISCFCDLDLK